MRGITRYAGRAEPGARPRTNERARLMETGEWIAIAVGFGTILIAIFGMGLVLIQKIDNKYNRLVAKIDGMKTEFDAKIDGMKTEFDAKIDGVRTEFDVKIDRLDAKVDRGNAAIIAELRSFRESVESRLNGTEREQARQEGVLSVLIQRDRAAAAGRNGESETSESPH